MRTILRFALAFVLAATITSTAYAQPPPTQLWSDPVNTLDIALSANGQYVAVATVGQVRFYGRSSSTPLWIYSNAQEVFWSVAISADGNYVVAGGSTSVYFWANAKSLPPNPTPTWTSVNLGGPIIRRCLAISDDGNYVAACGELPPAQGSNVFYWAGATGNLGVNIGTTWDYPFLDLVGAIAISDDGNHVAAVGFLSNTGTEGVLAYWNNAISLAGHPQQPTWSGQESGELFVDVAMSDDGNYVAVAGLALPSTVFYWAGATSRTGTSEPHTWAGGVDVRFTSVDMSCDGDSVIAGAGALVAAGAAATLAGKVYFWGGARSLTGNPAPSWIYPTNFSVEDVAINDAGTYMAAVDLSIPDTVYFFDRQGNLLWQDLTIGGDELSISCDGGTLAVGESVTPDTAYLLDTGFSTPCCGVGPVGGVLASSTRVSIQAPYMVMLGFAAAASVAVVALLKKRRI